MEITCKYNGLEICHGSFFTFPQHTHKGVRLSFESDFPLDISHWLSRSRPVCRDRNSSFFFFGSLTFRRVSGVCLLIALDTNHTIGNQTSHPAYVNDISDYRCLHCLGIDVYALPVKLTY